MSMPLQRFVRANPGCVVAGPNVTGLLLQLVFFVVTCAALAFVGALCLVELVHAPRIEWLFGIVVCGWLGVWLLRRALARRRRVHQAWSLRRRGRLCYAVGQTQCLLVDAQGRDYVVALRAIRQLDFDGAEPYLRVDADDEGRIVGALFDLFDGTWPGPRADRFVAVLSSRLSALQPEAAGPRGR
jgi:hypothetical protein